MVRRGEGRAQGLVNVWLLWPRVVCDESMSHQLPGYMISGLLQNSRTFMQQRNACCLPPMRHMHMHAHVHAGVVFSWRSTHTVQGQRP